MKNKNEKGQTLRDCALPLLVLFLLVMNLLGGCSAEDSHSSFSLASFGKSTHHEAELLSLVNPWNSMDSDYVPPLAYLSDGTAVDERCIDDLRALLIACREAGCAPYICSAYRTWETQTQLYENKVARLMDSGLDEAAARSEAAKVVAYPGTSEHQLGLAVDIIDSSYTALDEGQESTATQRWLMENSWRYGFILRYPEGKSDITGIIYEPWHYRYVGREAAADIYQSGLCFEEWLDRR